MVYNTFSVCGGASCSRDTRSGTDTLNSKGVCVSARLSLSATTLVILLCWAQCCVSCGVGMCVFLGRLLEPPTIFQNHVYTEKLNEWAGLGRGSPFNSWWRGCGTPNINHSPACWWVPFLPNVIPALSPRQPLSGAEKVSPQQLCSISLAMPELRMSG